MITRLKSKIDAFVNSDKDTPVLAAFFSGLFPLLQYYASNYWMVNSISHLIYFSAFLIGFSLLVYIISYLFFVKNSLLRPYKKHLLFVLVIFLTTALTSLILSIGHKKISFVLTLGISVLLSFKFYKDYKKILVLLFIAMLFSVIKIGIHIYEDLKPNYWTALPDAIENVKFKEKPNVYMIQPDGYVSKNTIKDTLYNSTSDLYDWMQTKGFKIYDNFRSNYPASLTSNASMFAMKHHFFSDMIVPKIEMANAREVISGENSVNSIFQANGYETYFIAQDEYFQQNKKELAFNFYNIEKDTIPYYTDGGKIVRNVFEDLKHAMTIQNQKPKFFFVEKLLPHHVAFFNTEASVREERVNYLKRVEKVNQWLKDAIKHINTYDKNSIIIILADHGGWVGIRNFKELYNTNNKTLINSTFSNLAAIQWNGYLKPDFDKKLRSNVNVFRVLFAVLSGNKIYLDALEDDSSYNINVNSFGLSKVKQVIDGKGKIITD